MRDRISVTDPAIDLRATLRSRRFGAIMADPPWRFQNATGEAAPEHRRLARYGTLTLDATKARPVAEVAAPIAHLALWVPKALLPEGLAVMQARAAASKSAVVWHAGVRIATVATPSW